MSSQKRRRARYELRTDCMVTSEDGRLLGERTLDGSWDGLHVASCHHAKVGERVHVALRIPRSSFWVSAEGQVARISAGRRAEDEAPSFGVELDRMHGMDRMVLGTALRREPRATPKRGSERDYARTVARIIRGG
jgi:hypothetical protein